MRIRPACGLFLLAPLSAILMGCSDNNGDGVDDATPPPAPPAITASFAFTAPGESLELANYTLVGKYDLPTGISDTNQMLNEASAVTYNKDTDSLFLVGDHGTTVVQVNKTGGLINFMQLPLDATQPQGTAFYDPEGIAYDSVNKQIVIAEERVRQLDRFTYTPGTTLDKATAQRVKLGTTIGNIGIEGVTFDPSSGGYIAVKEKDPKGIFLTQVNFAAGTASNGSATTENSTNLFDPAKLVLANGLPAADIGDVYALSNVLASTAADYTGLLVLSQESETLFKTDRSGNIAGLLSIPGAAQTEGVTLDKDLNLYFANELGGGPERPQLWVYKPTTSRDAVGVSSNLYVTFSADVVAGSGNIVVSNTSGDTRTIAVTDATQITFKGKTVIVNPKDDLQPGARYTVQVPDGVLKSGGVDITGVASKVDLSFSTVNDNFAPTLVSSAPTDGATAVTGSRITLNFSENVQPGGGTITLTGGDGDSRIISSSDITQVTFAGTRVDVNPSADLHPGTAYSVKIANNAIRDVGGNFYAGINDATTLNFTTAGTALGTVLAAGDVLFMAANADPTDAVAFVLLKAVNASTQIGFTDKDYTAGSAFPTNEAGFIWTSGAAYPAGTIVTIQVDNAIPVADKGTVVGAGGGISTSAETYYAFQGQVAGTAVTVDRFLAAINLGTAAGQIPAELTTAGAYIHFDLDNAKYTGSLDISNLATFAARVKDTANWTVNDTIAFPLTTGGSLF